MSSAHLKPALKIRTEYRVRRARWLFLFSRTVVEKRSLFVGEFVTATFDWIEIDSDELNEALILSQVPA